MKSQYKIFFITSLATALLHSCAVPKVVSIDKNNHSLPDTFAISGNESSVGKLQYQDFFTDVHLQTLISSAIVDNFDLNASILRMEQANYQLKMSKAAWLPNISALLRSSATQFGKYTMEGVGNYDTNLSPNIEEDQKVNRNPVPDYFLGLNVSWEVDLWGKIKNQKKAAQYKFLSSMEGVKFFKTNLISEIAILYYELIALDMQLKSLDDNLLIQEKALEIIEIQRSIGKTTELAVQQTKAQYYNTEAKKLQLQQQMLDIEKSLSILVNKPNADIVRSNSFINIENNILNKTGKVIDILENRPDVKAAYNELLANQALAKSAKALFYPQLNINAYGAMNAFSGKTFFNPGSLAWQILGGLSAPIFQQNQIKNQFAIANTEQEIALNQYQYVINKAYNEVNTTLKQIINSQSLINIKNKELAALNKSVEIANDLYITGYANYLEIITAQKNKIESSIDIIEMNKNLTLQYVSLYKALGGGTD